jgi:delta-aminolevulinic acid dehydratase/porphobilinogen synthase
MTLLEIETHQPLIENRKSKIVNRPRRLRTTPAIRAMVRETELNARDFIYPLFVRHGTGRSEIRSMPGVYQLSVEESVREAEAAAKSGVNAVILFEFPKEGSDRAGKLFERWNCPTRQFALSRRKSQRWL